MAKAKGRRQKVEYENLTAHLDYKLDENERLSVEDLMFFAKNCSLDSFNAVTDLNSECNKWMSFAYLKAAGYRTDDSYKIIETWQEELEAKNNE